MSKQDTRESVWMALQTLHAHKFRSFLTVLGVVIGTVTVMVIASFISGLDQKFKQDIEVFGTNTIFIYTLHKFRARLPITSECRRSISPRAGSLPRLRTNTALIFA